MMKTLREMKNIINEHKLKLKNNYGVKEIGFFGSYVRGEQIEQSDIDILVEFEKPIGFIKFMKLETYLADLLGIKVDLVTRKALKPYIGRRIMQELENV
ncbi:MAG: nucleotidyltransferase family protein [Methanomicrobiales archaeon]|nr:nucleotidyltransferase family protein [Methanomicrobiales archaeon]